MVKQRVTARDLEVGVENLRRVASWLAMNLPMTQDEQEDFLDLAEDLADRADDALADEEGCA